MTVVTNTSPWLARAWHPTVPAASVGTEPMRVVVLGRPYVLVRLGDGAAVSVFDDRCPHRFARLSHGDVVDGCLRCPYHGWAFDHAGVLVDVPALGPDATLPPSADLAPIAVAERFGFVWIAPESPLSPLPDFPEWHDASLGQAWLPPVTLKAGAAQFIDNFLDFAHFPFVHAGTFGTGESPLLPNYSATRTDDGFGFVVDISHTITNNEDPLVATGEHPAIQPRHMVYTYAAPFTVMLRLEYPMTGMVNAILTFCTPVTDDEAIIHTVMLRNDIVDEASAKAAVDYELAVFAEDLSIVENLPDSSLDVAVNAQRHTRADRITVEYRRILAEMAAHS